MSNYKIEHFDISIIVPIYNVEDYLEECLKSIYAINNLNIEVILVNDESPDNCHVIIDNYQQLYPSKTRVFNRKNGGLSAARNSGTDIAQGKYILFVDSDDYINPLAVNELFKCAESTEADIVTGDIITFWDRLEERVFEELTLPEPLKNNHYNGIGFLESCFQHDFKRLNCWNKLYRKRFLQENHIKFIEGILFEDVPFAFSCFLKAKKVIATSSLLYYYRQRPNSIMSNQKQRSSNDRLFIVNNALEKLKAHNYTKGCFDDYLCYLVWENAYGSGNWNLRISLKLIKRFNLSLKSFLRVFSVILRIPFIFKN